MKSLMQLQVPGRPEYVRVARLAISGVASAAWSGKCSVDQLDEIKQSVGEACSNAVATSQRSGGEHVNMRCNLLGEDMIIEVSPVAFGPDDIKRDERTEFQFFLIKTLMDDVELLANGDGVQTIQMKRGLSR